MAGPLPGNHSASTATLEILSSKFLQAQRHSVLKWFLLQHRLHVSRQNGNKAISDSREGGAGGGEATREETGLLGWRAFDTVLKVKWV